MRLVLVPWWMQMCLHREGLAKRDLLDSDTLSLYVSQHDLQAYNSLGLKYADTMGHLYGIPNQQKSEPWHIGDDSKPCYWSSPFEHEYNEEVSDRYREHQVMDVKETMASKETFVQDLFGRQLTREDQPVYSFYCEDIPHRGDKEVLGVFACLLQDPTDKYKADHQFVRHFLETLYAHQYPLTELARYNVLSHHLKQIAMMS